MNFSSNLRSLRKQHGMSQEDLANKLGYKSFTTIQKWESGVSEPSVSTVKRIAGIFGVTMDQIINDGSSSAAADPLQLTEQEKHIISIYHDLDRVGQEKFTAFGEGLLSAARAEDMRGHYTFTPYENYMVAESGPEYQMWSNKVNDQLMEDADRIAKKEIENASNTKKMVK